MKKQKGFQKKKLKLNKETIYILSKKGMHGLYTGGLNPTTLDPMDPKCAQPDTNSCVACGSNKDCQSVVC